MDVLNEGLHGGAAEADAGWAGDGGGKGASHHFRGGNGCRHRFLVERGCRHRFLVERGGRDLFLLATFQLVAGQGLPQHRHQRPIARQKDGMGRVVARAVTRSHVQAHERFAGPGHARHKHDRLPPPLAGSGNDPLHRGARDREVHGPRVAAGDVVHRVAGVERPGRLDDRGRGGIRASAPGGWGEGTGKGASHHFRGGNGCRHRFLVQRQGDRGAEAGGIAAQRRADAVGVGRLPAAVALRGLGGTEDREDRRGVARGVEVLEVEAIVPGLLVVELLELLRPHLELDRNHGRGRDEHGIHPPAEPRDVELEVDPGDRMKKVTSSFFAAEKVAVTFFIGQGGAEHGQLQPPRGELLGGERVAMRTRERGVDLVVGGAEERGDRVGIEGGVEARAGLARGGGRGGHGGQPTRPGGQPWSRRD